MLSQDLLNDDTFFNKFKPRRSTLIKKTCADPNITGVILNNRSNIIVGEAVSDRKKLPRPIVSQIANATAGCDI